MVSQCSQETTWEKPSDFQAPPPPPPKEPKVPETISLSFQVPITWRPGQYVTVDLPGGGQQLVGMAPDVVPGQTVKVKVPNPAYKKGAPPPPPSPGTSGKAQEWIQSKDPKSGRLFYLNTRTKETRWDKPNGE